MGIAERVPVLRVLGMDPAFRAFGLCVADVALDTLEVTVRELHLVRTRNEGGKQVRKSSDDLRRARELADVMTTYARRATIAISEVPSGAQSARAAWSLGCALGVLAGCPIPLIEVSPAEVKRASVGSDRATKRQMIEWAAELHPDAGWLTRKQRGETRLVDINEHLADAVAAIHAGVQTPQFRQAAAIARAC